MALMVSARGTMPERFGALKSNDLFAWHHVG